MSKHPLVISYFTEKTLYEDHATRLKESLDRLGLRYHIEGRPDRGSWIENCSRKASFIRECRAKFAEPVLWLDADAILLRPIHELKSCAADFAAVRRDGWSFMGGQIFFNIGPGADLLLNNWCEYCHKFPHVWDQVSLGYAWWDTALQSSLVVQWLDETIYDKAYRSFPKKYLPRPFSKAAVRHSQASHKAKRHQPARPEFTTNDLPEWWRRAAAENRPFEIESFWRYELGLQNFWSASRLAQSV